MYQAAFSYLYCVYACGSITTAYLRLRRGRCWWQSISGRMRNRHKRRSFFSSHVYCYRSESQKAVVYLRKLLHRLAGRETFGLDGQGSYKQKAWLIAALPIQPKQFPFSGLHKLHCVLCFYSVVCCTVYRISWTRR